MNIHQLTFLCIHFVLMRLGTKQKTLLFTVSMFSILGMIGGLNSNAFAFSPASNSKITEFGENVEIVVSSHTPTHNPGGQNKEVICHKPGTPAEKTIEVPPVAVPGHIRHGDNKGPC